MATDYTDCTKQLKVSYNSCNPWQDFEICHGSHLKEVRGVNDQGPRFEGTAEVDFLIVGAGAAGGIVAKELSAAGFRIVVLEQGPYVREDEFRHDELRYLFQSAIS